MLGGGWDYNSTESEGGIAGFHNKDLVIFGLPRSANTTFSRIIKSSYPNLSFRSHLHDFNSINAVEKSSEVIVLVRDPQEAVISYINMQNKHLKHEKIMRNYDSEDDFIFRKVKGLVASAKGLDSKAFLEKDYLVLTFNEIVDNSQEVLNKIYNKFPKFGEPKKLNMEQIIKEVELYDLDLANKYSKIIEEMPTEYYSHLPNKDRKQEQEFIKSRYLEKEPIIYCIEEIKNIYRRNGITL
jgi:hypothetical protein